MHTSERWMLMVVAALLAAPAPQASADKLLKQVRFAGIHPIPKAEGGGICYIEGPHVHTYAANKLEFREHGKDHRFVGDPVAYGWDGPRFAYKGPHPIHVDADPDGPEDVEYCYLTGPHFHSFAPADDADFTLQGNAYFYVGTPAPAFLEARPRYIAINDAYRPMVYVRPTIEVEAPRGWIGARAELLGPQVVVAAPSAVVGVDVRVPMPSLQVGIGVNLGGPAVVVHDRPVIIEERGHHDNGRHEGRYKRH